MLSEAEKHFFKPFKGFTPRENTTREDAFRRLARQQGWNPGTAKYNKRINALNRAAPIAKPNTTAVTSPPRSTAEIKASLRGNCKPDYRKINEGHVTLMRSAQRDSWRDSIRITEAIKKPKALPDISPPKLTVEELTCFKSFKGFNLRKRDTFEGASMRLVECKDGPEVTTRFNQHLEALRKASASAKQNLTTPAPTGVNVANSKSVEEIKVWANAMQNHALVQPVRSKELLLHDSISEDHPSAVRPRGAEGRNDGEILVNELSNAQAGTLDGSTASKLDQVTPLGGSQSTPSTQEHGGTDEEVGKAVQVKFALSADDHGFEIADQEHGNSFQKSLADGIQKMPKPRNLRLQILPSLCRSVSVTPVPGTITECKEAFEEAFASCSSNHNASVCVCQSSRPSTIEAVALLHDRQLVEYTAHPQSADEPTWLECGGFLSQRMRRRSVLCPVPMHVISRH